MKIKPSRYLVISDLQVPYHHEAAVKNVIKLARREKFDSVLVVGDEIDFQSISKWSEQTPLAYSEDLHADRELCKQILWDLGEYSPEMHVIRSNHTDRLYNTLLKVPGLINLPELQYPAFMGFAEMGITYHKTAYEFYPGWVLCHGDEGSMSQHAGVTSLNLAKKFGKSVLAGHSHRLGMSAYSEGINSHSRTLYGVEVGNLMDRKKASYIRYGSANWQMGFAILEAVGKTLTPTLVPVNKDGSFTALGRYYG
jgi:predicted phosphodiesterase